MVSFIISQLGCCGNIMLYNGDLNLGCITTHHMIWVCLKTLEKPQNIILQKLSVPMEFRNSPTNKYDWIGFYRSSVISRGCLDHCLLCKLEPSRAEMLGMINGPWWNAWIEQSQNAWLWTGSTGLFKAIPIMSSWLVTFQWIQWVCKTPTLLHRYSFSVT